MQIRSTLKILILFSLISFSISVGYQCNINNCAACSYPNACGICNNNFILTMNTTSGSFYCNAVTCPANCMTCYQNNTCQVCNNNFFITINGTCSTSSSSISPLPANCLTASNMMNCQLCSYGYTLLSGFCYPTISMTVADQNCAVKMTSSLCQICVSPFIVGFLGNCVMNPQTSNTLCNVANCLYCQTSNSTCITCSSGYQLTPSGTCVFNFCNITGCSVCSNSNQCQSCMNGYNLMNGTCTMIGYGCNINSCITCSSSQSCGQCKFGYQLMPFQVGSSTFYYCQQLPCPFNVTNCMACTQNYNSIFQFNQVLCEANSCMSGYINVNGYCVSNITTSQISCNVSNCQSCSFTNFCSLCINGYSLSRYGTCLPTMCNVQNCRSCSLNNICQQCMAGYFLTNGNIALLTKSNIYNVNSFNMVNQQQCTLNTNISCNIANCLYCMSNNVCGYCSNGYDLDNSGVNCIATCNVMNCFQCAQSQNITTAACIVCSNGYTLSSNGMQCMMMNYSCGSSCVNSTTSCIYNQQMNMGQCLQCNYNTILYNGQCYSQTCNIYGCDLCAPWSSPNLLCLRCQQSLTLIDGYCVASNCNNNVTNCANCIENGKCIGCQKGYILQNMTNGTVTCISAGSLQRCFVQNCLVCVSTNPGLCQMCSVPYIANSNGECVCNFQNCLDCSQSALTCNSCPPPLFASLYSPGCTPQPSLLLNCTVNNCQYCLTSNQCSVCAMGYSLNLNNLQCTLNNCSNFNNCQLCDPFGLECHLCNTGFMVNNFLQGGSCSPINPGYTCNITGCAVCSSMNNSICATCLPTYYLSSNTSVCTPNSCNISNCYLCLSNNMCTLCLSGYYLANNMQCVAKFSQIVNCQGSINYCAICVNGLYNSLTSSTTSYCIKCMDGFQYNTVTNQCLPQQNSIPNCLVQIPNYNVNNLPMCIVCQQGYYINSWGGCSQYMPNVNNTGCNVYNCMYCGLNSSSCSFCFVPWGISSNGICQTNISVACTQPNCNTCANSTFCTVCTTPFTANLLGSCILCNIAGCSACQTTNNCSSCLPTFNFTSTSNLCIACNITNCINCTNNNVCANCQSDYSISTSGNTCVTCNISNCLSCKSNGVCGVCANGFLLNSINNGNPNCIICNVANCLNCINNNVCSQCATGYTQINGNCVLCLSPCATCNSNGSCATCIQPLFYSSPGSNGSCFYSSVPNCMTYNLSTLMCNTCINPSYSLVNNVCIFNCNVTNCTQCSGTNTCQTCSQGFYLSPTNSSNCISCGISACLSCDPSNPTNCTTCMNGFYPYMGQCKQCPSFCAQCTAFNSCATLVNNNQQVLMTINSQNVVAICSQGCSSCSNINPTICISCINGLYFNNGICQLCNQLCLTCSSANPNTCLTCYPNSFLNNATCITCSTNCQSCSINSTTQCTSCFTGFYLNITTSTCIQGCPLNCLTCSSSSVCTTCTTGYTLFGQGICAPCVTNCRSCAQGLPASCIMCGAGFYLSGSICIQCATNCAICTPAGCSNCIQGYFLTSALTCSVNCQLPCSTCSANFPTKCTSCIAGYSYSSINNQCIQQLTCNGACSVCPIGYILQLGQCIQCNVTNCQQCNTNNLQQCLSCAPGYYLNSNGCQPCQSSCATCLRGSGCTSCASGYTYNSLQNIQPSGYQCIACQSPCLTCLNSNTYCTSCVPGYTFTGWKCTQSFFFGFTVTLTVNSTIFNQNYYNFITALSQAIGSSNPNIITITGITFGSVIVDGGAAPTASSATLQSNQQFNSLDSVLGKNNQIAGMTVGSSSITVIGGSIDYDKLNLALILGICIPVGVLIIVGISLYLYCKKKKRSQIIESKIKQESGFTVRQSFQLSTNYKEKNSSRPFQEFTSIN